LHRSTDNKRRQKTSSKEGGRPWVACGDRPMVGA
jgi:hypothetical protein